MRVKVRYFAAYREAVGKSEEEVELKEGSTLDDLLDLLFEKHPVMKKWSESILLSVNRRYADGATPLKMGDVIALLPPVSGGAILSKGDFNIEGVISSLKTERSGAIVLFIGVVRKESDTDTLIVESYPEMAKEKFDEIMLKAREKFAIHKMEILHRVGQLKVGENIVLIGVSAEHRADAFKACRWAIDELKRIAPIWKKDGGGWIGEDA